MVIIFRCLAGLGLRVSRISNTLPYKRSRFLRALDVNVVLDGGANVGQYASELRRLGFSGRIVSFEPLAAPFETLQRNSGYSRGHECRQVALGKADGPAEIQVSENLVSSSLLEVLDESVRACPSSGRVGAEQVTVCRLDTLRSDILEPSDRVHLKLDTQGTELDVLLGAEETLKQTVSLEIELSFVRLYRNQPLVEEVLEFLRRRGFRCVWIECGFTDEATGRMLQADGLFVRETGQILPVKDSF